MNVALLGHTGFVGSHLREAYPHAALYNSSNLKCLASDIAFADICFDLVFCACVPAVKWMAQQYPEQDADTLKCIQEQIACLKGRCRHFVLISTIDVHNHAIEGQREDTVTMETTSQEPYGRHRYAMEQWCLEHIAQGAEGGTRVTIVRLPALFGIGLKKNIVYDMLHNQRLNTIQPDSVFQWYDLAWLVKDIQWVLEQGLSVAHLYPEPLRTADLVARVFPEHLDSVMANSRFGTGAGAGSTIPRYNHRTLYPERFARSSETVLEALTRFVSIWRWIHGPFWGRRMACTNLAWDSPKDDMHAIFVLKRYGIHNVELALTRYGQGSWDAFLDEENGPRLLEDIRARYASAGMRIVSLQSLLYGAVPKGATLASHKETILDHLKKVIRYANRLGAKALVFGSPSLRVAPATEEDLCDVLERVRKAACEAGVYLCLEPNAHGYGCTLGCCMAAVQSIVAKVKRAEGEREDEKDGGMGLNFDTGNAWMEMDTESQMFQAMDQIRHMQISAPYLKTAEEAPDLERLIRTYRRILTSDLADARRSSVYVSIEAQCSSEQLASHIRRVAEALGYRV